MSEIDLYIDIETIPGDESTKDAIEVSPPGNIKKQESIDKWMDENADTAREEQYRKQSFNGGYGQVQTISVAIGDGDVMSGTVVSGDRGREATLLDYHLNNWIDGWIGSNTRVNLIGFNIEAFDLPFLRHRCVVLGVSIPTWLRPRKRYDTGIRDLMTIWAGWNKYISQDELCSILGIEGNGDFGGSMVYDAWLAGEYEKIANYCASDVEKVRAINEKFKAVGI